MSNKVGKYRRAWLLDQIYKRGNQRVDVLLCIVEFQQGLVRDCIGFICSGCNEFGETVDRDMFDGMCVDCTQRALYDEEFAEGARRRNEALRRGLSQSLVMDELLSKLKDT